MKIKLHSLAIFLLICTSIFSQRIPVINTGEKHIDVKKLKIDVSIVGDVAITTYDMHFYNANNRVLEGELSFPLEENQSVVRFALEINNNLREAVVVEKEKARVAFESTVVNRIDPALLEKTKGNNYKARIYPIPAKGYKRVVVAFQQKLLIHNEAYFYKIPFNYKKRLENFSFKMLVFNQKNKPIIDKGFYNQFKYQNNKGAYFLKHIAKNERIKTPLVIKIPLNSKKERIIVNNDYFYFSKQLDFKKEKIKLENDITIFWDKSFSLQNRKLNTELEFLESYFDKVKYCKVNLVIFNTKIREEQSFSISNGNWFPLKSKLENIVYDGGSSFDFLNEFDNDTKLNLLFTDGLNTLSNFKMEFDKKTHVINSSVSANHVQLKNIATQSGGVYTNLQQTSVKNAFDKITTKQIQFLGTNFSNDLVEVYPKKGTKIQKDFSLSGKMNLPKPNIKLYFGSKKDTVKIVEVDLTQNSNNNFIEKIWAQKKLDYLGQDSENNQDDIIALSRKYQVISDFTSMLILDRIEDYVTHKIEPPKELQREYHAILERRRNNEKQRLAALKRDLFLEYKDFFVWYGKDFIAPVIPKETPKKEVKPSENLSIIDTITNNNSQLNSQYRITGTVKDGNGVLPGVFVSILNKSAGAETDFDGKFSIDVNENDILTFSYLGYVTQEIKITDNSNIIVNLEEDDSVLEEVVVVGYATRNRREIKSAVSRVSAENTAISVAGTVAGVSIVNADRSSNENSNITIRGANSMNANKPIYVLNGVVVDDISKINSSEIKTMYTLNKQQSSSLYGSRGLNGVVVITTKSSNSASIKKAEEFDSLVNQNIKLKGWNPKTPYLKILKSIKNTHKAYEKYLDIRKEYSNSPSFFIDVADFFKQRKFDNIATQILTNVAEIDLDNYELLRALAYKFEEYQMYNYAVFIYQETLKLRPEDIQSYRDLALAYEQINEYQISLDLLYKIVNGELLLKDENRRFKGIEVIALNELNRLITLYKDELNINHINQKFISTKCADLKIVIDWNHKDTDIDLWVIDPNKEKCFYSHTKTKIGGLISNDMTRGFGPEQFMLKEAIDGKYKIKVNYYANSKQKISGPTFLKVTIFKNYSKDNEIKTTKLVRLKSTSEVLDLAEVVF